jgi:DNA-binding transcriptional LysR family regulator
MDFELRHLRYFVSVAEELHFGRAARKLGVSQPPLSRQIVDLERAVGAQLLERTRRTVSLTNAGAAFLVDASAILRRAEDAVRRTREIAAGARGTLSIAFSETAAASGILQRTLDRFRRTHPSIELHLEESTAAEQALAFERGELDVAFGYRLPILDTPRVEATQLFADRLLVALPQSDPMAKARRWLPHALSERTLLFLPRRAAPELHGRVLQDLARLGIVPRHVRDVRRLRAVFALVACGAGFGLVPESTIATAPPGLAFRKLPRFELRLPTFVLIRRDATLPYVRAFVDAALQ